MNNPSYETRITKTTVLPAGEPIFSSGATHIAIDDEGGGELVTVSQDSGSIRIDPGEWRSLCDAIEKMIRQCRGDK